MKNIEITTSSYGIRNESLPRNDNLSNKTILIDFLGYFLSQILQLFFTNAKNP